MKVDLNSTVQDVEGLAQLAVEEKLRWALGGYASEILSAKVSFGESARGRSCHIHIRLRGARDLRVRGYGKGLTDALRFAASRAGASVARHLQTDRIQRGNR